MSGYDNTNTGIFSHNDRKTDDKHPDFKGQINVDGVEYWLDGWIKERKDGSGRFYSLRVKAKDAPRTSPGERVSRSAPPKTPGLDDDIPFAPEFR